MSIDLDSSLVVAESAGAYWTAGILTIAAAAVVTAVMLLTSGSKDDEGP